MTSYVYVQGAHPAQLCPVAPGPARGWVLLPPGEAGLRAARSVAGPALAGVCASVAGSASEIAALGTALAEAEESTGLPVGRIAVMPAVATAAGVFAAAEIARAPRVERLLLGEAALRAELRLVPGPDECELLWVRSMVVAASAAAGIAAPVADECPDPGRFAETTAALRRLGFGGRVCTGPEQLERAAAIFAGG
jgi:citrate lyase subunit beta/citryl-CoA lyase